MRAIVDSQKLDLCAELTESERVLEWKHKSILSACQNAKGRAHERRREREMESERGHLKASVVSSGDGQPKHLRAV